MIFTWETLLAYLKHESQHTYYDPLYVQVNSEKDVYVDGHLTKQGLESFLLQGSQK